MSLAEQSVKNIGYKMFHQNDHVVYADVIHMLQPPGNHPVIAALIELIDGPPFGGGMSAGGQGAESGQQNPAAMVAKPVGVNAAKVNTNPATNTPKALPTSAANTDQREMHTAHNVTYSEKTTAKAAIISGNHTGKPKISRTISQPANPRGALILSFTIFFRGMSVRI